MAESLTLDDALRVLGERVVELGRIPTLREYTRAMGVSSSSVAGRWMKVLAREGYLELGIPNPSASYVITGAGYRRLWMIAMEAQS